MTNDNRPMLLMDIDGVLNLWHAKDVPSGHMRVRSDNGFRLTFRPEWAEWIEMLTDLAEPVWATMWQDEAARFFAPATGIGIAIKRHIDFDKHATAPMVGKTGVGVGGFKHPGVEYTVGNRPFVWVDDDLQPWQHKWAAKRTRRGIPTLLVQPNPKVGLTATQAMEIEAFLIANSPERGE